MTNYNAERSTNRQGFANAKLIQSQVGQCLEISTEYSVLCRIIGRLLAIRLFFKVPPWRCELARRARLSKEEKFIVSLTESNSFCFGNKGVFVVVVSNGGKSVGKPLFRIHWQPLGNDGYQLHSEWLNRLPRWWTINNVESGELPILRILERQYAK